MLAAGAIFRDDLLRRRRDAEIHHAAEQQHPGPDIDIDAVIGAAHPARQQDLREIGKRSADDADDEDRTGEPSRHRGFAGAADKAAEHRAQPRAHVGGCGLGVHHGQNGKSSATASDAAIVSAYQRFVKIRLGVDNPMSSPRTRGPIPRVLSLWHAGGRLSSSRTPVAMGPCYRRDDKRYSRLILNS
ncbi:hypothetical protein GALL_492590 [mine drainage metagenome]|uniref:Uncharacterized protein n=1 Tax=mine drainage metagenome TaxID=410659 RepID=A0A1J5PZT6_9ZZZZ